MMMMMMMTMTTMMMTTFNDHYASVGIHRILVLLWLLASVLFVDVASFSSELLLTRSLCSCKSAASSFRRTHHPHTTLSPLEEQPINHNGTTATTINDIVNDNNHNIRIPILYESDRILIVDKPAGIAHHNSKKDGDDYDDGKDELGIMTTLQTTSRTELYGVHRLDRVTSGILVVAKDSKMAACLTDAFTNRRIQKVYVGISAKPPKKKKQGWVQGGMSRSRDKSWKLVRTTTTSSSSSNHPTKSKNFAKTRFFTATFQPTTNTTATSTTTTPTTSNQEDATSNKKKKYTCILFRPYTGKTHQLRVAAKAMGIPLLGDPIYKDGSSFSQTPQQQQRTHLHASGISIPPLDGHEAIHLWCPPPFFPNDVNFQNVVLNKLLKKYCDVPSICEEAMKGGKKAAAVETVEE